MSDSPWKTPLTILKKSGTRSEIEEKLVSIRSEIVSTLEDRLRDLETEALKMQDTVDQVQQRLRKQGFAVKLDDLRSGRWYRVSSEVRVLQEVLVIFETHGV